MKQTGVYLAGALTVVALLAARPTQDAGEGVVMCAVGSSEANRQDVLWVVQARPLSEEERKRYPGAPRTRITICAYRAPAGAGTPMSLNVRAARDATLDHELSELVNGDMSVAAVKEFLKKK